MQITHLNPDTLHRNPAFSQGVVVDQPGRLIVVGGQNGTDANGAIVAGGLGAQTRQALKNVLEVLKAAGATQEHVIKLTILIVAGQSIQEGFAASQEVWGRQPTAITAAFVAALARPDALVEIEALAALP